MLQRRLVFYGHLRVIALNRCAAIVAVNTVFGSMRNGGYVFAGMNNMPNTLRLSIITNKAWYGT